MVYDLDMHVEDRCFDGPNNHLHDYFSESSQRFEHGGPRSSTFNHRFQLAQPHVTTKLNKQVRYAYPRLGNPATIDVECHALFSYVESYYKLNDVDEDMKQWDCECDAIVENLLKQKMNFFDTVQSIEVLRFKWKRHPFILMLVDNPFSNVALPPLPFSHTKHEVLVMRRSLLDSCLVL